MGKKEIYLPLLLKMLDSLRDGKDLHIKIRNQEKVIPLTMNGKLPCYELKSGKLILQNPNKPTLFGKLAKAGIPIAWFIPKDPSQSWILVTKNRLAHIYYQADPAMKRKISIELNKRTRN